MRRILAALLSILIASPAYAGWLDVPFTSALGQSNAWTALQTFTASPGINLSHTAPSMTWTDTTASAKSLTIAVDANLAQFRESAGGSQSLLNLDLATTWVGLGIAPLARLHLSGESFTTVRIDGTSGGQLLLATGSSAKWGLYTGSDNLVSWWYGASPGSRTVLTSSGWLALGSGFSTPASLLDLRAGDLTMSGANGQKYVQGVKTELTTIAAAATTATTITIPANAILKAVEMRVTVQPPGTSTMVVTATTSGTILQQGASMSTAINTTDVGTRAWGTNYVGVAAQTITITPNVTPSDNTGRVRFTIYYDEPTVPTS